MVLQKIVLKDGVFESIDSEEKITNFSNKRINVGNWCLKVEDDGSVVLEDNNSKFGSLVLIQKEIEILKGNCLNIQVGTNYLTFAQKKKTGFFSGFPCF